MADKINYIPDYTYTGNMLRSFDILGIATLHEGISVVAKDEKLIMIYDHKSKCESVIFLNKTNITSAEFIKEFSRLKNLPYVEPTFKKLN